MSLKATTREIDELRCMLHIMAEFAALALAGNIVQFIEFSVKLFREGKKTYESSQGSTNEQLELEAVTIDIEHLAHELQRTSFQPGRISKEEEALWSLASECEKLARNLLVNINKVKVKDGHNRKWQSFKQALSRIMKEKDIRELEERLTRLQNQLGKRLLFILSGQQSTILSSIRNLEDENRRLGANTAQKLNDIKDQLLEQAKRPEKLDYSLLGSNLMAFADEGELVSKQLRVLKSLRFPNIKARHGAIKLAHTKTFQWIFQVPESSFANWLKSGSGMYWVQGKAGSGKSTLLRYLSEHAQTKLALESWSSGYQLFIGSHFFWNAGSSMQKSQQGLLQTLLYQLCRQCPDLIQEVCSGRWNENGNAESDPWGLENLSAALLEISKTAQSSARFCFFVDGLDEYDGNHQDLIVLLHALSSSLSIKICVSSRPWNVFSEAFGGSHNQLKLEELTKNDIKAYVQSHLGENIKFKQLQLPDPNSSQITEIIVKRAQGVFLWVSLVVGSLLRGLVDGDDSSDMRRRLNLVPSDLEDFFAHIIRSIEPFYHEETVRCFDVAMNALQPLPAIAFKYLETEQKNRDFALDAHIKTLRVSEIDGTREKVKTRLNARCKDLLEVIDDPSETDESSVFRHKVDFLHRTVRDFFLNTNTMEKLRQGPSKFDYSLALCRIMVALIKTLSLLGVLNRSVYLVDELLHHAREIELHCGESDVDDRHINEVKLLDELDRVMNHHTHAFTYHWSNIKDDKIGQSMEFRRKTFLALAIQAKLTLYVQRTWDSKQLREKCGRPLLDYALRPSPIIPTDLPDLESEADLKMVGFLLDQGADPNEEVAIYDYKTVWDLFLRQCFASTGWRILSQSFTEESHNLYSLVSLLIKRGADPSFVFQVGNKEVTIEDALRGNLTINDHANLKKLVAEKRQRFPFLSRIWNLLRFLGT